MVTFARLRKRVSPVWVAPEDPNAAEAVPAVLAAIKNAKDKEIPIGIADGDFCCNVG